jgi:anti-anti-sigma factor
VGAEMAAEQFFDSVVPYCAAGRTFVTVGPLPPQPAEPVFERVGLPTAGGVTWLWARRDLDMATVATARRELSALLEPVFGPCTVLVYLGHECFVDIRGLRLLVDTAAEVRRRGGALGVVAPPRCLRRLVQLALLDAALPLIPTARQAVGWAHTHGPAVR